MARWPSWATCAAQNRVILTTLEKGETANGPFHYQLYNHAVFGDPALQLGLTRSNAERPAHIEQRARRVTVFAPERWHRFEYEPLAEWGCPFPHLYTWRGAGAAVENSWYDAEKRNDGILYINVEARTRRRVTTVEAIGEVPAPLGWTGSCFVDEHADGSRSLYWRVRMIDGDMKTGNLRAQVDRLEFRLLAD